MEVVKLKVLRLYPTQWIQNLDEIKFKEIGTTDHGCLRKLELSTCHNLESSERKALVEEFPRSDGGRISSGIILIIN